MPIRIEDFGGLVPRLNPARLPGNAAQVARNVNLTAGVLTQMKVDGPFTQAWEDDGSGGARQPRYPGTDLVRYRRLDPIASLVVTDFLTNLSFVRIVPGLLAELVSGSTNATVDTLTPPVVISKATITPTIQSFDGYYGKLLIPAGSIAFTTRLVGVSVATLKFTGPYFGLTLNTNAVEASPKTQFVADPGPRWDHAVDLHFGGQLVARAVFSFTPLSVFERQIDYVNGSSGTTAYNESIPYSAESVNVSIQYARLSSVRRFAVRHAYVREAGTDDQFIQPLSNLTDYKTVEPNQYLKATIPHLSNQSTTMALYYRGENEVVDRLFELRAVALGTNGSVINQVILPPLPGGTPAPPNGNYPPTFSGLDESGNEAFRVGLLQHPAGFYVARFNSAGMGELWFSDYGKAFIWPKDWRLAFTEEIQAIGLVGRTVIVWTTSQVWAFSGSDPSSLAVSGYLLSDEVPLLAGSVASIARVGGGLAYASSDGLALASPSSAQVITKDFFTREDWLALGPQGMRCTVADNSLFAVFTSGKNLRFDFDEGLKRITEYDDIASPGAAVWRSRRFVVDQPTMIEHVAVDADGPVALRLYANGETDPIATFPNIPDGRPVRVPDSVRLHADDIEVEVELAPLLQLSSKSLLALTDPLLWSRGAVLGLGTGIVSVAACIDPLGEFAYFGTNASPGTIVKVDMETLQVVGTVNLAATDSPVGSLHIFGSNLYGVANSPVATTKIQVFKVSTSGGAITRFSDGIGTDWRSYGASALWAAGTRLLVVGHATSDGRNRILSLDTSTMALAGGPLFSALASANFASCVAVVPKSGTETRAIIGCRTSPAVLHKVGLSTSSTPTDVNALALSSGENEATCIAVDPAGEFAYVGLATGRVVKVAINGESSAMTREASILSGLGAILSMVIVGDRLFAAGGSSDQGTVVRIDLGTFTKTADVGPPDNLQVVHSIHKAGFALSGGREIAFAASGNEGAPEAAVSVYRIADAPLEATPVESFINLVSPEAIVIPVGSIPSVAVLSSSIGLVSPEAEVIDLNPPVEPDGLPIHVRSLDLYERQVIAAGESPQVRLTGEQVTLWEEFTLRWDSPVRLAVLAIDDEGSWQAAGEGSASWEGVSVQVFPETGEPVTLNASRASKGLVEVPLAFGASQSWRFRLIRKLDERVNSFSVWTLQQRPVEGDAIRALGAGGGRVPEWMFTSYQFDRERAVASFRCLLKNESSPVRFALHADDSPTAFATMNAVQGGNIFATGDTERSVPESPWMKNLRLRMLPTSPDPLADALEFARLANVVDLQVYLRETVPIEEYGSGVIVRDAMRVGAWRNKVLMFEETGRFAVVRVVASSYGDNGIRVRLMPARHDGDGFFVSQAVEVVATDYRDILIPDTGYTARNWALEVERGRDPDEVHLIPWKEVFLRDGRFVIRRPNAVFSWRAFRMVAEKPFSPSYCRIVSSSYPVSLRLSRIVPFVPGSGDPVQAAAIDVVAMGEEPFRLPRANPWRAWRLEIDPDDPSNPDPGDDNRISEIRVANSSRGA